jgi:hypothetical protein
MRGPKGAQRPLAELLIGAMVLGLVGAHFYVKGQHDRLVERAYCRALAHADSAAGMARVAREGRWTYEGIEGLLDTVKARGDIDATALASRALGEMGLARPYMERGASYACTQETGYASARRAP